MKIFKISKNDIDTLLSITKSNSKTEADFQQAKTHLAKELIEIDDNRIIFAAAIDDNPVAMVQIVLKNADNDPALANSNEVCHIHNLQVRKDCQHHGIGRKMMEYVEEHAKEIGKKIVTLGVDGDNSRAIRLYKKRNYHIFKEEAGRTAYEKLYLMKKKI